MAIPAQVYDCIKQPESTVEKLPVLAEALSSVNYPSRMHALLCLERAAIDFELQRLMVFKAGHGILPSRAFQLPFSSYRLS